MIKNKLQSRFAQVKLLALDVDGILTDGGLYYTESGEVCKKFNVKDGKGIKLLMKLTVLQDLCQQLNLSFSQVAYMGDDLNDLSILESVGLPLTVSDAIAKNRQIALYVTERGGGQGAVREVCDLLVNSIVKVQA